MHAHPSDLLRFAREGRLYDLLTAYRPDVHDPHWGQLLDAAARSGRVSVVVWLIRLRALLGRPCDPVAVLPLDAEPRVVEVCRQIREVDDALEYHLLIQEQRAEDEAREAEERAREAELEAREAKEAKEAKAQRSQPRAPSPEETLARARRLSDEEDARDLARFWAGLDE